MTATTVLQSLYETYGQANRFYYEDLVQIRDGLQRVTSDEITSAADGRQFLALLRKFREAVAEIDKLHGDNYPNLLNSLLSVGEDGLYSDDLRFIFELIQNVDDCSFPNAEECRLDMKFDINSGRIILTYNEVGFTPFNVFAITGIAERAKNLSASRTEIGEKGIGFKSVFGVAEKVLIRSGWFSFELHREDFTIPVESYADDNCCGGTQMTLYVPGKAKAIYDQIKRKYCRKDALFSRNPILFLNKLTSLKMYYDSWRSMEFHVSRTAPPENHAGIRTEPDVAVSVHLHDYENGREVNVTEKIICTRYTYHVTYSGEAYRSRYPKADGEYGRDGKKMLLQAVMPNVEHLRDVGAGSLYSFLPTQLKLTVPVACHAPFKLAASREFVDPQNKNLWFDETSRYLSELMDHAYSDWCKTVGEHIIEYLPRMGESLFRENNGKEKCLSEKECFLGDHYLRLPLFKTVDGGFRPSSDIFCFAPEENIAEPEQVCRWMGFGKAIFIPPTPVPVGQFGIDVKHRICAQLFRKALADGAITKEVLTYLDSVGYEYPEKDIPNQGQLTLMPGQIEAILRHGRLGRLFQKLACDCIRQNKPLRFTVSGAALCQLSSVLDTDFDIGDAPKQAAKYMAFCGGKCLFLDIDEDGYLPCGNAIVLSARNALSSFAEFCHEMDPSDTFAIRIRLREASEKLNQYTENGSGSAVDYLRELRNIRLSVRDSIGVQGYRNYIDLILRSGTDRGRFIQELLQNADDCEYPQGVKPQFVLKRQSSVIIAKYNEAGFTRANIRSITAIGESTKNKLLNSDFQSIGEKGVGFKTIFAIASEVRIHSGDYCFALTDREPTIPKPTKSTGAATGTRMEIVLKDNSAFPACTDKSILELCLCLRKLRELEIDGHKVTIEDIGSQRIITIDKRRHTFTKYVHNFTVDDEKALAERENGTHRISRQQQIICFVPGRNEPSEYCLYAGLPTKHKINIPLVIDAPFALTTSREQIETDCASWNDIVRREMYAAILSVMDVRKAEDRWEVLRFARFVPRFEGSNRVYRNGISDSVYLTSYPFLNDLRSSKILPTYHPGVFAAPGDKTAYRYPGAVATLLKRFSVGDIDPASVIDVPDTDSEAAQKKNATLSATLNALECQFADFETVYPVIEQYAEDFIHDADFRTKLYEYLQGNTPGEYLERLKQFAIIPVFGKAPGKTQYVRWEDDKIFVKKGVSVSGQDYYVLNEKLLPKSSCENMLGDNINEMNDDWERARYNKKLREVIRGTDVDAIYLYLINEFRSGAFARNGSRDVLLGMKEYIPLKNQLGEIVDTELFLCSQPAGHFPVRMIQQITIHEECAGFAQFVGYQNLRSIHYEDVGYHEELSADDVKALLDDDFFTNADELLRGFYRDGYLSDELLHKYELDYLATSRGTEDEQMYDFPESPVSDWTQLRKHIDKLWEDPGEIISEKELRTIHKVRKKDCHTFYLDSEETRRAAFNRYTPEGAPTRCFCQMCKRVKPHGLIEVNNIEIEPKYYFPQLRISLCLECSKRFKNLRINSDIRNSYLKAIDSAVILDQGKVDIPIGKEETLTFTAKHLAEIQEILRRQPVHNI